MGEDLIRRDDAIRAMLEQRMPSKSVIRRVLVQVPAVDAVEVVRCKDCKNLGFKDFSGICNRRMIGIVKPDDFCSYGERRCEE